MLALGLKVGCALVSAALNVEFSSAKCGKNTARLMGEGGWKGQQEPGDI